MAVEIVSRLLQGCDKLGLKMSKVVAKVAIACYQGCSKVVSSLACTQPSTSVGSTVHFDQKFTKISVPEY